MTPTDEWFGAIDLAVHDRKCRYRFDESAFRYHQCPECKSWIDTFGGNVG